MGDMESRSRAVCLTSSDKPEGAADIERDVAGPLNRPFPYGLRQLFG